MTTYIVRKAIWDEKTGRSKNIELFKSTSQIQVVLYLRDMWYDLNGWDIPPNPYWDNIKKNLAGQSQEEKADS